MFIIYEDINEVKKIKKDIRRNALQLIAAFTGTAIVPSMSFSQPNKALDRINEITKGLGATESDIYLDLPEIAENGNQVKVSFEMDSPMTESDHVKTVYILADGNPSPNVAKFYSLQKWDHVLRQLECDYQKHKMSIY